MTTIFVTGTDTEIGKTWVTARLLQAAARQGLNWAGFKPVAAGAETTSDGLRNDDALQLKAAMATDVPYETLNPLCLKSAIAPHIAAAEEGVSLDWAKVMRAHDALAASHSVVLAEGAGGWQVPLDGDATFADRVSDAGWPVLLVVGMRLGCINHALLTAESISRRTRLLGWVANCLPPEQPRVQENIETLRQRMPAPLLGVVPGSAESGDSLTQILSQLLAVTGGSTRV